MTGSKKSLNLVRRAKTWESFGRMILAGLIGTLQALPQNFSVMVTWKLLLGKWLTSRTATTYIDKVKTIRRSMQDLGRDPLAVLKKSLAGNQVSFTSQAITPEQVDKIIRDLKNSKASGIDNLDTYILKLTRKTIVSSVCHILNLSLQTNN